mmetsp:Transcript_12868/g.30531  ORF Transcript_12868/g.30531 Transcript_12868/m.30531 type:complete len:205 (+) Transcript_12868:888-1502(+)
MRRQDGFQVFELHGIRYYHGYCRRTGWGGGVGRINRNHIVKTDFRDNIGRKGKRFFSTPRKDDRDQLKKRECRFIALEVKVRISFGQETRCGCAFATHFIVVQQQCTRGSHDCISNHVAKTIREQMSAGGGWWIQWTASEKRDEVGLNSIIQGNETIFNLFIRQRLCQADLKKTDRHTVQILFGQQYCCHPKASHMLLHLVDHT